MKVTSITQSNYYHNYQQHLTVATKKMPVTVSTELPQRFYYPVNINFTAANARNLKTLFSYGLPCIYTGVEMIDSAKVQELIKNNVHKLPVSEFCKHMDMFVGSLHGNEKEVYQIIKAQAELEPSKNVHEILQSLKDKYEVELISKQLPILKTLMSYSYALPEEQRLQLVQLLSATQDKLNNRPMLSNFSIMEFKYKLAKIESDIARVNDKKSLNSIKYIIKLSKNLMLNTEESNMPHQKKVFTEIQQYFNKSNLIDNKALKDLLEVTKAQLYDEKTVMTFSRKSFLYDLSQIIKTLDDPQLKEIFMKIAEKLPSSDNNNAAYIIKYAKESPEKVMYRLLWPSIATIEHLLPKSCGGEHVMANYAGACARENSDRHNLPFLEQLKRRPLMPKYCQKYVNRLIKYAKAGIFARENIDIKYIEDFKQTIEKLSNGTIVLDTSALYKGKCFPQRQNIPRTTMPTSI